MIEKIDAVLSLVPDAQVSVVGTGPTASVTWISPPVAPVTDQQINDEYYRLVAEEPIKNQKNLRHDAYIQESDPIFFKWQRGEATEQEWKNKVEEIKQRYPY